MSRCKLRTEQIERIGSVLSSITSFGDTEIKIRPIRQITLPGGFVDVLVSFAFGASTRCEYGCAEHLMWEELGLGFDLRVLEQLPQQLPRSTHRTWQPWRRVAVHRPLHFCYGLFAMVCVLAASKCCWQAQVLSVPFYNQQEVEGKGKAPSLEALKYGLSDSPKIISSLARYLTMNGMSFEEKLVLGFEQNTTYQHHLGHQSMTIPSI